MILLIALLVVVVAVTLAFLCHELMWQRREREGRTQHDLDEDLAPRGNVDVLRKEKA